MRINHRDLENFFIFARENGIHKIDFKRFRPVGRGNHHKNTFGLTKSENADALSRIFRLSQKYPEMDISTDDPLYGMVVSSELHRQGWTDTAVSAYIKDKQIFGCKAPEDDGSDSIRPEISPHVRYCYTAEFPLEIFWRILLKIFSKIPK